MNPSEVSAIVICGSRLPLIEQCITSLAAQSEAASLQLILVNNALLRRQECESLEHRFATSFAGLDFVHNAERLGFATNNNLAVRVARSDSEYLLFLNDDTIVQRGALREMLATCSSDPTIGVVSPRLIYPDGKPQRCASYFPIGWDGMLLALTGRKREVTTASNRPFWLRGVCLLVRRAAFEAVGGWDSNYDPGYGEDIELCYQLWTSGWRAAICEKAIVTHYESQSFQKYSDTWYRLSFCGMLRFINRHARPAERPILGAGWLAGLLLRLGLSTLPLARRRIKGRPRTYLGMLSCLFGTPMD